MINVILWQEDVTNGLENKLCGLDFKAGLPCLLQWEKRLPWWLLNLRFYLASGHYADACLVSSAARGHPLLCWLGRRQEIVYARQEGTVPTDLRSTHHRQAHM